jgi:hypothetical protein
MTAVSKMLITLSISGIVSYAENWNGKVLDASCYDTNSSAGASSQVSSKKERENLAKTCAPTASTKTFAFLDSKGVVFKLDDDGNSKAAAAFQSGSLKGDKDGDMHASLSGTRTGDAIKVDSIHGRGERK